MADFSSKKQCDRCGVRPATGKLFCIPWTGDCLCKDCIDKDKSIQKMLVEIYSMAHDRHLHSPGIETNLPDEMDMIAYVLEPDEQ